jgi:hypothetical protein
MAFKNGLSERLDELRFPSPRSPPSSEIPFPGYSSLSPGHSNFVSAFPRPSGDVRSNLQRRFTTDASKLSSWNYMNNVGTAPQMPDALDLLSSVSSVPQDSYMPHTPHSRSRYSALFLMRRGLLSGFLLLWLLFCSLLSCFSPRRLSLFLLPLSSILLRLPIAIYALLISYLNSQICNHLLLVYLSLLIIP